MRSVIIQYFFAENVIDPEKDLYIRIFTIREIRNIPTIMIPDRMTVF